MCSTPNAAAVLMIDPRLNGWLTDSSSRQTVAPVARRHDLFSRLTSVGPSCLATGHLEHPVARPGGDARRGPPRPDQPLVQRVCAEIFLRDQKGGGAGGEPA